MPPLLITEKDVEGLLRMDDALGAVEEALRALGRGEATNRPRQRVGTREATVNIMLASWPARGYAGFKYYTTSRTGIRFWVHLFDIATGELVAVIQADRLGQQRTGAASGVATKYLARSDASTLGIVGTGWQAQSQLEAICAVRSIRRVRCYGRDKAHRDAFAKKMSSLLGVTVQAASSAEEAIRDADVAIAATNAPQPVIHGDWLRPGCHINAIGANRLETRELDDVAVGRCAFVATDSIEQAKEEGGDLVEPMKRGLLAWGRIHEMSEVVTGKVPGRTKADDITLFKSHGIAIEDVAVAALVFERARDRGIGQSVAL
jgi:ornithine cyclodeaminase/alanine dehydrogenase